MIPPFVELLPSNGTILAHVSLDRADLWLLLDERGRWRSCQPTRWLQGHRLAAKGEPAILGRLLDSVVVLEMAP